MIVVCGDLGAIGRHERAALAVARAAAAAGNDVQLVGIVPEGVEEDARLIALASAGVGHAAALRMPLRPLERADLDLALRYLPDVRVIVALELDASIHGVIGEASAYTAAFLILVTTTPLAASEPGGGLPSDVIVLEAPPQDRDGTFAGFVGTLAAKLDAGAAPADAWDATLSVLAVDAVSAARGPRARRAAG